MKKNLKVFIKTNMKTKPVFRRFKMGKSINSHHLVGKYILYYGPKGLEKRKIKTIVSTTDTFSFVINRKLTIDASRLIEAVIYQRVS